MSFFSAEKDSYLLRIKLAPGASFDGFRGIFCDENMQEYLKCGVTAGPEKGKANKALILLLAKTLKIAKNKILLVSGETDHQKKLRINILPSAEFTAKLDDLIKE